MKTYQNKGLEPLMQAAVDRLAALPDSQGAIDMVLDAYAKHGLFAGYTMAENLAEIMEAVLSVEDTHGRVELEAAIRALSNLAVMREQRLVFRVHEQHQQALRSAYQAQSGKGASS